VVRGTDDNLYVTGLQPGQHGYRRGARVILERSLSLPGSLARRPVALLAVVEKFSDAAQLKVLCQRDSASLLNLQASVYDPTQQRLFAGRCGGTITERIGRKIRIDLGLYDDVEVGARYRILHPERLEDLAIATVTDVQPQSAWAELLGDDTGIQPGFDVVFHQSAADASKSALDVFKILVVTFAPSAASSSQEQKLAQIGAYQLSQALHRAAQNAAGISVQYAQGASVGFSASDADGHAQARKLGQQYHAQIVVWGVAQCSEEACLLPRFTVVDPQRLQHSEVLGLRMPVAKEKDGFNFRDTQTPPQVLELTCAVLGQLAFRGQKYADAAFYLRRAINSTSLSAEDSLRLHLWAAYAQFTNGQVEEAQAVAQAMVRRGETSKSADWKMWGLGELVRIEMQTGSVTAARSHLQELQRLAIAQKDVDAESYALHIQARLEVQQGRVPEALALYARSLALSRQIGDVKAEAVTLHAQANLEAQQGRLPEALALYARSLTIWRQSGDVVGEAATLLQQAHLEARQGRVPEARTLYKRSLALWHQSGNVKGEAYTLAAQAVLERRQGRVLEAWALYDRSLTLLRQIGDIEGELSTRRNLGHLEVLQGHLEAGRQQLEVVLTEARRRQFPLIEADSLSSLGTEAAKEGKASEARTYLQQARVLYMKLQMRPQVAEVDQKLQTLGLP